MIINVYFEKGCTIIPFDNQHVLNGVIYNIFGHDKHIHNSFSEYSISSIQGCRYNSEYNGLEPYFEPYIQFTSNIPDIINKFVCGVEKLIDNNIPVFYNRKLIRYNCRDFMVNPEFDIIKTISPVLLKDKGRSFTYDDEGWKELLHRKTVAKLNHHGIYDDTFRFVLENDKNVKNKLIMVNGFANYCTSFVAKVYGNKKTRETIYNLGIGGSTGSGFGSVAIIGKNKF